MAGQLARLCAAIGIAAALAGCSPTAAPQNKGTATAPIRRATSHATRGTDKTVHRLTTPGGFSGSQYSASRNRMNSGANMGTGPRSTTGVGAGARTTGSGNTFFGLLRWPWGRSVNPGTAAGTTRTTRPAPAVGGTRTGSNTGVGSAGLYGASRTRSGVGTGNRVGFMGAGGMAGSRKMTVGVGSTTNTGTTGTGTTGTGTTTGTIMGQKPLQVIAFFTVGHSTTGFSALGQNPKAVSYLAPWWYTLKSDGSLHDMTTAATRTWVTNHKLPVAPLITNGGQSAMLQSDTAIRAAAQNVTNLVKQNNFAGVNIDFQGLSSKSRTGLNAFIDDLSHNLRPMGKTLTVDIIPTQAQTGSHGAYDEVTLSKYADQLVLMTYDRHDNTSAPGPVSPHNWVVSAVKHTLQAGVPANKIILGVNTYGYNWNVTNKSAVTLPEKLGAIAPTKNQHYDAAAREMRVAYTKNGSQHVAYYPGPQSLTDKLNIAKKYKLYGIAIWKVGYESPAFWRQLIKENGYASTLHGGNATNSGIKTGSAAAARTRKAGTKGIATTGKRPMAHRPIGTRTGRHHRPMRPGATKPHMMKHSGKKATKR